MDAISNILTACLSSTRDDDVRGVPELPSKCSPSCSEVAAVPQFLNNRNDIDSGNRTVMQNKYISE